MLLRKSREFTVNMGNYESVKIGASVEIDTNELDTPPQEFLDARLEEVLAKDIEEASALTNTRDSFILSWGNK